MLIRGRYFQAMIDTGSSLTLLQESCWRQLRHKEQLSSSRGQTFKQANGQVLSALGMWNCECEVQGRRYDLTLYVMKDEDLTVPVIVGMGMWNCECEVQGRRYDLTLYVMKDEDLTVPVIVGMDFLMSTGISLDF